MPEKKPEIDQFGVEVVRAKDKATGAHKTIPASWLDTEPGAWTVVESSPALNPDGTRLPDKVAATKPLSGQSNQKGA